MRTRHRSLNAPISVDRRREIDALCTKFEQAWRADQRPRIEDYLGKVPEECRQVALRELIAQEVDLRLEAGESVEPAGYLDRFPQEADAVNAAFALLDDAQKPDAQLSDTASLVGRDPAETDNQPATAKTTRPLPERIGRFQVQRHLGHGGFGEVYLARDPELDRRVALKLPREDRFSEAIEMEQFITEARTAAKLDHPGIVTVYEVSRDADRVFIVQEYVDGPDLKKFLESTEVTPQQAAELMIAIAEAVAFAHHKGFVHRDLTREYPARRRDQTTGSRFRSGGSRKHPAAPTWRNLGLAALHVAGTSARGNPSA